LSICLLGLLGSLVAVAQQGTLGDPMRPFEADQSFTAEESAPRQLSLTAVLISSERKIAIINGALYREGDSIAGAIITRIEPQGVHLRRGSELLVVPLNSEHTRLSARSGDPTP
jgi:hypothetical protein